MRNEHADASMRSRIGSSARRPRCQLALEAWMAMCSGAANRAAPMGLGARVAGVDG